VVVATVGGDTLVPLFEKTYAKFLQNLKLNVGSAFLVVRHAAPKMGKGRAFVFISSTAAAMSFPGLSSYCAGKAALDHFARTAANELGPRGIRLNAVRPHTDVACAVRFLASPEASWITGQSLAIDGGNELREAPQG
jgi:NAD(P)-dependent dehydrogenase (short-subunit alcohol dehydrogenase family)